MRKANELFDKEVVNQTSGEKQGTIRDLVFDEDGRSIVAMMVGGLVRRNKVLRWRSISSVGEVVVIESEEALVDPGDDPEVADLRDKERKFTGTDIVTEDGEKIGSVDDLFVDERGRVTGYEVKRGLVSGNKFLPIESVRSIGKDAIITGGPELMSLKEAEKERG